MSCKHNAPACDQNKGPILEILKLAFANSKNVLEIGSGTGQHAVHFARYMPHLTWQPTELEDNISGIKLWLQDEKLSNIKQPLILNVNELEYSNTVYDTVFTANTFHIMSWDSVCNALTVISKYLEINGKFLVYGPFKFNRQFTSPSNAAFHQHLMSQNCNMGIREFNKLQKQAKQHSLKFIKRYSMPANNEILEFIKY